MSVTTMQAYARQYIEERHRLGFAPSAVDRALRHFAAYVDDLGREGPLCIEVMATWARHPIHGSHDPKTWARRLKGLRPFTRWLRQFEPGTEVPEDSIFGSIDQRLTPHIYTEQEITDLLAAAHQLQPPLRGTTYATLFGLLACTGLRVSEALHLRNADVDLKVGLLRIRQTKFAKSRQIPHPSDDPGGFASLCSLTRSRGEGLRGHAIAGGLARPAPRTRAVTASGRSALPTIA